MYIFFLFYLVASTNVNKEELTQLSLIDTINNKYFVGIHHYTTEQFIHHLMKFDHVKSTELNLYTIITKYDDDINRKHHTIIGKFKSIISTTEFGNTRLETFLAKLNEDIRMFSKQVENVCISLMCDIKKYGLFEHYSSIDTIYETKNKLERLNSEIEKSNKDTNKNIIASISESILSATNYDVAGTVAYLSTSICLLYDKLKSRHVLEKQMTPLIEKTQSIWTKTQRLDFESRLFVFSQVYCSMGYNLQIGIKHSTIQIIGDRVPYMSIINFITTLEENIYIEIEKFSSKQHMTESIQHNVLRLDSLRQKLSVLKELTYFIHNIVNFSFILQIAKMTEYTSPRTLIELEEYFTDLLKQLNNLLDKLNKKFPVKDKNLEEITELIEEDIKLQLKQINISILTQNAESILRQHTAELVVKENREWWLSTKTIVQSFIDIGLNSIFLAKDNLKKYTGALVDLASQAPLELVNGLLRLFNEILYSLFSNSSGLIIIFSGLFIVEFTIGGVSRMLHKLLYNNK